MTFKDHFPGLENEILNSKTFKALCKQFHAGAVKPEPGFCGSGCGFFQSVRCPIRWTKLTEALGTRLSHGKGDEVLISGSSPRKLKEKNGNHVNFYM